MISKFYLPVLKSKQGEFDALFKLSDKIKKSIVPLLEITPMEWDHSTKTKPRTMEVHLENFCKKVIKKWPSNNSFIDTELIKDKQAQGMSCIEYIFQLLAVKNITPIPVVHLNATDADIRSIDLIRILYDVPEIALRLTINNITSPNLSNDLDSLIQKLGVEIENYHLILDLNASDFTNVEDFSDGILDALADFPNFKNWKTFTICGGSFPKTNLLKVGINQIPRNEWKFYKTLKEKLSKENFNREINYGDYSMVAPGYFEYDPLKMSRSANIRYTHNDIWYVVKGKALKKSEDFKQYVDQAKHIMNSNYYLGETFSEGDTHLKKCSKGETTPGSPTVWNWVGNNHHFTKVIHDLFANFPAA